MNNLFAFALAAAFGALISDETAADSPWQRFVVDAVVIVGYAAVVTWLARRHGIDRTVPGDR